LCAILDVMLLTLFWRFRVDDLNTWFALKC
jgi:hypothetical protein